MEIPRDRQGMFEPQLVSKQQTHWTGFDDKVLSLYARGMTVREIQGHLEEMYGTEVSPSLISAITVLSKCLQACHLFAKTYSQKFLKTVICYRCQFVQAVLYLFT